MVDIFHYKNIIETINEEQSFSKAAKKLYIPQPSLSVMVRKIEEEIGLPLFDRTSKPIRLTEAGREYLNCANEIKIVENNFSNYVDSISELQSGSIRIGASQMLSELVLPLFLSEFLAAYPKIEIQLTDANTTTLVEALSEGNLDLIIDNRVLDDQIFERKTLTNEQLLLAVPSDMVPESVKDIAMHYNDILHDVHKLDSTQTISLELFKEDPFVLLTKENQTRSKADALFHMAGFTPHVMLEVDRLTTMFRYVAIGTGASFVSDILLKNLNYIPENVSFFKIDVTPKTRDIFVSYKRSRYYSKAMEVFIEELAKYADKMSAAK